MFGGEGESDKQLSVAVPQSQSTPSPLHCPRACNVTCKDLAGGKVLQEDVVLRCCNSSFPCCTHKCAHCWLPSAQQGRALQGSDGCWGKGG